MIMFEFTVILLFFLKANIVTGSIGSTCPPKNSLLGPPNIGSINDVKTLFKLYDESVEWPSICLIIRTFRRDQLILKHVIRSFELFWPSNVGKQLIIADAGEEEFWKSWKNESRIEKKWDLVYENIPKKFKGMSGKMEMQWSNFYSDLYCNHEKYVTIFDADSPLTMKVTPDLLFDKGKPIFLLSRNFQKGMWTAATDWMLKLTENHQEEFNGMISLPVTFELSKLPLMRQSIAKIHKTSDFDEVIQKQILSGTINFSQFCIIGTWLYYYDRDNVSFRITETDYPVIRWGDHLPYNPPLWSNDQTPFYWQGTKLTNGKLDPLMYVATKELILHGVCFSLPSVIRESFDLCKGPFTKTYPSWWWQYHECRWNVKGDDTYEKVTCNHFLPLWEKLIELHNNNRKVPSISPPILALPNISVNSSIHPPEVNQSYSALYADIQALYSRISNLERRNASACLCNTTSATNPYGLEENKLLWNDSKSNMYTLITVTKSELVLTFLLGVSTSLLICIYAIYIHSKNKK